VSDDAAGEWDRMTGALLHGIRHYDEALKHGLGPVDALALALNAARWSCRRALTARKLSPLLGGHLALRVAERLPRWALAQLPKARIETEEIRI